MEDYKITREQEDFFDIDRLKFMLERSNSIANGADAHLQKSTDRLYTIFGFVLTIFLGITAYTFNHTEDMLVFIPCTILSLGLGIAGAMLYSKAMMKHRVRWIGELPSNMINDSLIKWFREHEKPSKIPEKDLKMLICSALEQNERTYHVDCESIDNNVKVLRIASIIIGITIIAAIAAAIIVNFQV